MAVCFFKRIKLVQIQTNLMNFSIATITTNKTSTTNTILQLLLPLLLLLLILKLREICERLILKARPFQRFEELIKSKRSSHGRSLKCIKSEKVEIFGAACLRKKVDFLYQNFANCADEKKFKIGIFFSSNSCSQSIIIGMENLQCA